MTADSKQRVRRILVLVAVGAAVVLVLVMRRTALGSAIDRCVAYFRSAGPWPFFLAMTLLPVFGFPVFPFTLAAGPVFAPTLGIGWVIVCALLAETVDMAICWWLAARGLRPWVERVLARLGYVMPTIPESAAWEIVLVVRIIPATPFFFQNYILGLARVPFGTYLLVSMLAHGGLVTGTILTGDALARGDRWGLAFGVVLCLAVGTAIYRLRKRWMKSRAGGEVAGSQKPAGSEPRNAV